MYVLLFYALSILSLSHTNSPPPPSLSLSLTHTLTHSIFAFPHPDEFTDTLTSAGFTQCDSRDIFLGTVYLFTCSTYVPPNVQKTDAGAVPFDLNAPAHVREQPVASFSRKSKRRARGAGGAAQDIVFDSDDFDSDLEGEEEERWSDGTREDL